jgi:MraZ protein
MNVFVGNFNAKTDVKGRAFVPASFRKLLQSMGESHLILRKDIYKDCLILYPEKVWEEEWTKLRTQLNEWDEEQQDLFRQLLEVEELELDSNGRILIPKDYLQAANISNDICFYGMFTKIEIWNPDLLVNTLMAEKSKDRTKKFLAPKPVNGKPE